MINFKVGVKFKINQPRKVNTSISEVLAKWTRIPESYYLTIRSLYLFARPESKSNFKKIASKKHFRSRIEIGVLKKVLGSSLQLVTTTILILLLRTLWYKIWWLFSCIQYRMILWLKCSNLVYIIITRSRSKNNI